MLDYMIPHNRPTLGKEEEEAALRVIRSGQLSQEKEVKSFEDEFCEFMNLPKGHAAALSSGSASLYLALWSLDAKGKKIIFPSYACSALGNAVKMADGNEIIIDNKKNSINLDLEKAKDLKHDIKIIPHMFGIPNNLSEVKSGQIIEDCAQSLGAKVNDNYVGTQGTVGIFSFYVTKMMTSGGQGGMIISRNKEIIEKVKDYREFDFRSDNEKRFNFQMTEIQAAIGREQLKKLPEFLEKRNKIFMKYKNEGLELLDVEDEQSKIVPARYRAIVKTDNPKKMIESLRNVGVKAIVPIEKWEIQGQELDFPNATKICSQTVSLPIYPSLTNDELDIILSGIILK